ncbi:Gibberellin 20-oxidase [Quillaja saponaria]|uniref:Gibberellin 20-oxidase n=1 Tax=Quillaja saponaria TaxID=32244 RepID=A0AAD7PLM1_QUISA|nr:Gibberellin 20-oxidase [Quillaja saponaria]
MQKYVEQCRKCEMIHIVPMQFVWPKEDLVRADKELDMPLVDLEGFIRGDEEATQQASKLIRTACLNHGFFQVINHGIDLRLITTAYDHMDALFKLPIDKKLRASRTPGTMWGYSNAHADRFSSKLPWKETFSFPFLDNSLEHVVTNYFKSTLGQNFEATGGVYQKYCEAMKDLCLKIMELLAISLGVDRLYYRNFFEGGCSIMRCNYYPCCEEPSLVLGTGPHCDSTSLTLLHQDQVGGLEVFADNKWQTVPPHSEAFVINIGDTFTALSNGKY